MNTPNQAPPFGLLELQAPIGIGPMSSRYSARDPGGPGEHSVIELRALHELKPEHRGRLLQLASLRHDGLLPIRSLHLEGSGPHYITVHGPNAGWLESAPRSLAGIRAALTELSDALAAAHREGIVHGTLEAAHVLRAPRGYWLDLTGTDPSPRPRRAPELANGQPATGAADVWALGTIVIAALPSQEDVELGALLAEMTAVDPESRPTADRVAGRIDRTMAAHIPSQSSNANTNPGPKTIPSQLGPYTLLEKLGEGGMGAVYRARGRGEDHDVALKVLLPEWSRDALVLARFRREARVLSQLCTPHIARFIAARRDAEWEYMVMEFVEGRSAHWLLQKRGPFNVRASLAIGCDIARALAEVHALELVHRDVKPSNILIAADSDPAIEPRSKLCDFGIVRPKQGEEATALTRTGTPGTPSYMAPEQAMDPRSLDPRSDVYALGVVLYELLTGRVPYTGAGGVAVVMAALNGGCASPDALRDDLPAGLSAAVMKALAPRAAERIASTRALGAALLPFAREGDRAAWERELTADVTADPDTREPDAGFATRATEPSDSAPQPAPVRRTPVRWVVGAAALALLGVAVVPRWSVRPADGRSPPAARVSSGPPQTPLLSASTAPTVAPASAADASVAVAAAAASLVAPVAAQRTASARARTPRVAVRARPVPAAPTATPAPPTATSPT